MAADAFEERDGGVYVEFEAVSLTRDVPRLVSAIVTPIVRQLPRDSLELTLLNLRRVGAGGLQAVQRRCRRGEMPERVKMRAADRQRLDDARCHRLVERGPVQHLASDGCRANI